MIISTKLLEIQNFSMWYLLASNITKSIFKIHNSTIRPIDSKSDAGLKKGLSYTANYDMCFPTWIIALWSQL